MYCSENPEAGTAGTDTCPVSAEVLVNAGFAAKELHQYDVALHSFLQAFHTYPGCSSIPSLISEIGGILKTQGRYDDAVYLFSTAMKSPAFSENPLLQQEFVNIIAYLRITKNILRANNLDQLPFSLIPPAIIGEIDAEYAEWSKIEEAI